MFKKSYTLLFFLLFIVFFLVGNGFSTIDVRVISSSSVGIPSSSTTTGNIYPIAITVSLGESEQLSYGGKIYKHKNIAITLNTPYDLYSLNSLKILTSLGTGSSSTEESINLKITSIKVRTIKGKIIKIGSASLGILEENLRFRINKGNAKLSTYQAILDSGGTIPVSAQNKFVTNILKEQKGLKDFQTKYNNCGNKEPTSCKSDLTNLNKAKSDLNKALQKLPLTTEYLVLGSLGKTDQKNLLKAINNNNCKDSVFSGICEFYSSQNAASAAAASFVSSIENDKKLQMLKNTNPRAYNKEIANRLEELFPKNTQGKSKFPNSCGGSTSGMGGISQNCLTDINNLCTGDSSIKSCKVVKAVAKKAYLETAINSSGFGMKSILNNLILGLLNPNQNAIQAAALFGFKANYSNVPGWLKEDTPSLICQAKIRGYLNVVKQTSFGTTQYKCQNGTVTNTSCIPSIVGNLKAQRTKITPNNETTITYSYYIKAPLRQNLLYSIGISYKEGSNEIVNLIIGNSTDRKILKAGQVISIQDFINFPVKNVSLVDKNSFEIGLLAVYNNSKQVYYHITAPIVLINYGSYYKGLYQVGNNKSIYLQKQDLGLSDSNMKNMMFG